MQERENTSLRERACAKLDQVVQSKTFRNLLLLSSGVGFVSLTASISAAALADYRSRANSWDHAYSSSVTVQQGFPSGPVVLPSLPLAQAVEEDANSTIDLNLAITTDNPGQVIASAAKSVLREDGKRYRVTVTVESTPTQSNEGKP